MAKKKKSNHRNEHNTGKRVVVNTSTEGTEKKRLQPTSSRKSKATSFQEPAEMLFGKENYILIAAGFVLVMIGMALMAGGHQAPNEWNPDEVYSVRRTMIAPLFILAGLITELVAIFKKKSVA